MDRGGRALREAIQQYLEAIQSGPGHSWLSAAAHALEESTRKGYAAALRRLRKHSREQFGASPRQVLELEMKEMVASENAEGNLKKLLSACRQLDKLRLHPRIVEAGDWQVVKWYAGRRWNCSSGWRSRLWTWKAPKSWRWPASAWCAYCGWEKRPRCAPVHVETSVSTAKKGGQASGPWTKWWVLFLWEIR